MKPTYNKSIELKCTTCGDSNFSFNEDKSWIKCNRCEREYNNGYDELVNLNQETINNELNKTKEEIMADVKKDLQDALKKAFKGNKNIKFK